MENVLMASDFSMKFDKLSEQNQKYIMAIQQALLYAQAVEKDEKGQKKSKLYLGGTKDGF
ncbi:MAG: hypothetical protein HFH36_14620 [Lachnospiraceae bacterium]|nr:hypothetical protein [Lachnospiraceae bacterium]